MKAIVAGLIMGLFFGAVPVTVGAAPVPAAGVAYQKPKPPPKPKKAPKPQKAPKPKAPPKAPKPKAPPKPHF